MLSPEPHGHSQGGKGTTMKVLIAQTCAGTWAVEILRSLHPRGSQDRSSKTVTTLWCRRYERTKNTAQSNAGEPFDLAGGIQIDRLASSPGKPAINAGRVWLDMERPGKRHKQYGSIRANSQIPCSFSAVSMVLMLERNAHPATSYSNPLSIQVDFRKSKREPRSRLRRRLGRNKTSDALRNSKSLPARLPNCRWYVRDIIKSM